MPDVGNTHWTFVDLPDGRSWQVWRQGSTLEDEDHDLFGEVRFTMEGYLATDRGGTTAGPFVSLDEAAYPLARSGLTSARFERLERSAGRPRTMRNPVVLAIAAGLAVRALLAMRGRG
jgi:hypothetical protein